MSDIPKDRIGNFVKKKIELDLESQSAWSTPPDMVFDNAMEELDNKKDKKKKRGFIILFSSLLLLLTLGYFAIEKSRLNELSENIDQVKVELEQINAEFKDNQLKEQKLIQEQTEINKEQTLIEVSKKEVSRNTLTQRKVKEAVSNIVNTQTANVPKTDKVNQVVNNQSQSRPVAIVNQKSKIKNSSGLHLNSKKIASNQSNILHSSIYPIGGIAFDALKNERQKFSLSHLSIAEYEENENRNNISPFSFGVYVNQNLTSLKMNPTSTGGTSTLTEYDKFYYGKGLTTQLGYDINKNFYVNLAFSYDDYSNGSLFQDQELYSKANEFSNTNGEFAYIDNMNIETPFGNYNSEMSFDVNPDQTANDEIINRTSKISQNFKTLGTALNIGYRASLSTKLNWYVESGVSYSYLFGLRNEMQTEVIMNNQVRCRMTDISDGMPNLNSGFFAWQFGTGIEYYIKENMNLNFGFSHLNSITSLRQTQTSSDPSLDLNQFQLRIGSRMRF